MSGGQVTPWPQERDGYLMELMSLDLTFAEIARCMGISRNAVAGRFQRLRNRMGWQAR